MDELTLDHIYQLPKKEKYKVFAYAQKRLRKMSREIRNKTEQEIDFERKTKCQM